VSHLESAAAVMRSRTLSLEGALRVKEREIERLIRLSEAAKVGCIKAIALVDSYFCVSLHLRTPEFKKHGPIGLGCN
jgi:hypothetical protein